jgi:hypothetical protein
VSAEKLSFQWIVKRTTFRRSRNHLPVVETGGSYRVTCPEPAQYSLHRHTSYFLQTYFNIILCSAIAQLRPVCSGARFDAEVNACGIYGGPCGTRKAFSPCSSVYPVNIIPPLLRIQPCITWGMDSWPVCGRSSTETWSHPIATIQHYHIMRAWVSCKLSHNLMFSAIVLCSFVVSPIRTACPPQVIPHDFLALTTPTEHTNYATAPYPPFALRCWARELVTYRLSLEHFVSALTLLRRLDCDTSSSAWRAILSLLGNYTPTYVKQKANVRKSLFYF